MTMARMSNDVTIPLVGVALSAAALLGILLLAKRAPAAQPSPLPSIPKPEPIGLLPDLKVGSTVVVDTARANIPPPSNAVPFLVCTVDLLIGDPLLVSVRAVGAPFAGTIPRVAIVKVLSGDFET